MAPAPSESSAAPASAPPPSPPPRARHGRRFALLVASLAILMLPPLAAVWLLASESGLKALAGTITTLSGGLVEIDGARGRLLDHFEIGRLRYADEKHRVEARGVALSWTPRELFDGRLSVARLRIDEFDLASRPSDEATSVPTDLRLPGALAVDRAEIGRLRLLLWPAKAGDPEVAYLTLSGLAARLASDGKQHALTEITLETPVGHLGGDLKLAGAPPFALAGQVHLAGQQAEKAYSVDASLAGPLADFAVSARASGWNLGGSAQIAVTPFAPTPVRELRFDVGEVDPAGFAAGAPHAALRLHGEIAPELPAGAPPPRDLAGWVLGGPVEIVNRAPGPLDQGALPIAQLKARARWQGGELTLAGLTVATPGSPAGKASGQARLKDQALHLELALAAFDPRLLSSKLKPTRLDGTLVADAGVASQSLTARLHETAPPRTRAAWQAELVARHADGRVDLESARLIAGEARFEASGKLNLAGAREFAISGRMARFDPALYAELPHATLNADLGAHGTLSPTPLAKVHFVLVDSHLATPGGPRPLAGRGDLELAPGRLARADFSLDLAGNRLDASGAYGRPGDRLRLTIAAPQLAALGFGLGGQVDASVLLAGTPQEPSGEVSASAASLRLPGGIEVASLELAAELREGLNGRFDGKMSAAGIHTAAGGTVAASVAATLQGTRAAHVLQTWAQLADDSTLLVHARGALAAGPAWKGSLDRLEVEAPRLRMALVAPAPLAFDAGQASLGPAEFKSSSGRLALRETRWTPAGWTSRGEVSGLQLGLALDRRQRTAVGDRALTLSGSWDLRADQHLNGRLDLKRDAGDLSVGGDLPLALGLSALALHATAEQDRVQLSLDATGERFGQLDARASLLLTRDGQAWTLARQAPLAAEAHFAAPSLAWLGPLIDPNLQLAGAVGGEVSLAGSLAEPKARGSVHAFNVNLALVDQGIRLSDGEIEVGFTQDRAQLARLSFRADPRQRPPDGRIRLAGLSERPGRLTGSGEIELASGKGTIELKADHLAVMQRADRWLMLSGEARIGTGWDAVGIAGRLHADAAYFELARAAPPSLSDDVVVRGREPDKRKPMRLNVALDIDLGDSAYFHGRGLDARLTGEVRLRAEGRGLLRASGSILTRDGSFDAYGQTLAIERGIVNFQGPVEAAGLNVLALRKGLPVEAGVEVSGSVLKPRVRLVSEPPVPDAEKLSWIVLGRGPEQAGGADTALLLTAAQAILGGREGGGGITRQLAQGLGLDQLSVSSGDLAASGTRLPATTVGGTTFGSRDPTLSSQIVTLGKRLSENTFLSYEQSLAGAARFVKLTHTLSSRLSLVGRAGTENSLDLLYTFSFN